VNPSPASNKILNVPNTLTGIRFLLAICVFVGLQCGLVILPLVLFIVAVSTDWIDGYWARRFDEVTQFGRIFDPFVDKIIICGTFVFLVALPGSGISPWVAVLVLGREMLVTVIRSFVEQHGGDFSANWPAKWKMVLQCALAILSMLALTYRSGPAKSLHQMIRMMPGPSAMLPVPSHGITHWYGLSGIPNLWLIYLLNICLWAMIGLTLVSGLIYVLDAVRMIRSGKLSQTESESE